MYKPKTQRQKIAQLKKLLKIPIIEQKTQEWYDARNNLITASDFAQALGEGKFGTAKQLIEKKVCIDNESKPIKNMFFEWGNLFEPVACSVYAAMHNTKVHEFGLIKHPVYDYFGASPDGITDDGIMLEIKCPFKRKITGDIPKQYYYQIQGQLDVCGLDECDYFECELKKYENYDEYKSTYETDENKGKWCGSIAISKDGQKTYSDCSKELICEMNDSDDKDICYWILHKYFLKRVNKDPQFVQEKLKELKQVWDKILYYRKNRDKFDIEVKNTINLETELYVPMKQCLIRDLE